MLLDLSKAPLDAPGAGGGRGANAGVLHRRDAAAAARLVTHLDVDDAGIDRAIEVLSGLLNR